MAPPVLEPVVGEERHLDQLGRLPVREPVAWSKETAPTRDRALTCPWWSRRRGCRSSVAGVRVVRGPLAHPVAQPLGLRAEVAEHLVECVAVRGDAGERREQGAATGSFGDPRLGCAVPAAHRSARPDVAWAGRPGAAHRHAPTPIPAVPTAAPPSTARRVTRPLRSGRAHSASTPGTRRQVLAERGEHGLQLLLVRLLTARGTTRRNRPGAGSRRAATSRRGSPARSSARAACRPDEQTGS